MRKNGFTLIELLAVIVILAIIALIATPIILGIINDAREKANERSVELYASAVRNGIAAYQLTGLNAPKSFSDLTIQYDGDVKCTVQELYEDGSFYLEGCRVNNGEKTYSYGTKQGSSIEVGTMGICNPLSDVTEGVYTAGDKYECDVDPNKEGYDYIFYVLNSDETSVNLIMDSNIRTGGEAVKEENPTEEQKGLVAWVSKADYIRDDIGGTEEDYGDYEKNWNKGPITAIEYLQSATIGWSNVNSQTISSFDVHRDYHYDGIYVTTYNIAKTYTVNARMPYYSEINSYNSTTGAYAYLYDYLRDKSGVQKNGVEDVSGYWILSVEEFTRAYYTNCEGYVDSGQDVGDVVYGVRPVINLSI